MSSVSFRSGSLAAGLQSTLTVQQRAQAAVDQAKRAVFLQKVKNAQEILSKNPHNPYAHRDMGITYMTCATLDTQTSAQGYRHAADHFKKAVEYSFTRNADNSVFGDWYNLGICQLALNELKPAIIALAIAQKKIATSYEPESPEFTESHQKIDGLFSKIRAAHPQLIASISKEILMATKA